MVVLLSAVCVQVSLPSGTSLPPPRPSRSSRSWAPSAAEQLPASCSLYTHGSIPLSYSPSSSPPPLPLSYPRVHSAEGLNNAIFLFPPLLSLCLKAHGCFAWWLTHQVSKVEFISLDPCIWAHTVLQESQPLVLTLSCQWHEPQGPQRKCKPASRESPIADKAPGPVIWSELTLGFMGCFLSPIR